LHLRVLPVVEKQRVMIVERACFCVLRELDSHRQNKFRRLRQMRNIVAGEVMMPCFTDHANPERGRRTYNCRNEHSRRSAQSPDTRRELQEDACNATQAE
jgi:hypothetical protein